MTLEDDILEGARTIGPYLDGLLDEEEAKRVAVDLQELLKRAEAGYQVDELILQVLKQHSETDKWLEEYLKKKYPPAEGDTGEKSFDHLTSKIAQQSPLYRCPKCSYDWHRRSVAQPIPKCPTHNVSLVRVV